MRLLYVLLTVAALVLAACNSDPLPTQVDWCYEFDFRTNDPMAISYGRWIGGVGYSTDENNNLGLSYSHTATVQPILVRVGIQKGAYGDLTVASDGTVFGISVANQATIPAAAPANTIFDIDFKASDTANAAPIGTSVNVTVRANGNILVSYLQVYGVGANPFPTSNCGEFVLATPPPAATNTQLPTSQPTWTPVVTTMPTVSPTPTATATATPAQSPTPTPTPTSFYYLGPIVRVTPYQSAFYKDFAAIVTRIGNDLIAGLIAVSINGSVVYDVKINEGVTSYQDIWPNNSFTSSGDNVMGLVQNSSAANFVSTAYPSAALNSSLSYTQPGISTPAAEKFQVSGNINYLEYRYLYLGWPTPTPTNTPTPTWSPTPTPTGLPTNQFTQTPAGPTFTPNPRATSITAIPYLPGNTYRGSEGVCKFGAGNYLWDFRLQSAYAQGWTNPYPDETSATFRQYVGMSAPIINGTRLARFLINLPAGATVSNMMVYSPSANTSWNVAGGFAPSRNPAWQAAMSGSGWNSSATLNGTSPTQAYVAVRTNNADPLDVMFIVVNVSNCQATPTATQPLQVQPPVSTVAPLPTIYNWLTPSGTYAIIGTPYGTPGVHGTPAGTPGTGTPTPAANGTPGDIAGDYGEMLSLGGDINQVVGNLFGIGRLYLSTMSERVNGIIGAWNTAPVTAPPGVPLCATNPTQNEVCAIFYIIRYTVLSGPAGTIIMPLATVIVDLAIVFLFIRLLRAVLARLSKVTEVGS
jgi:hypothetical protein